MAVNIRSFPGPFEKYRKNFYPHTLTIGENEDTVHKKRIADRFLTAFALGSSAVVLTENVVEEKSLKANTKSAVANSGLIAGGVTTIALTAAGATQAGRAVGAGTAVSLFVDAIKHPGTWACLFLGKLRVSQFKKSRAKSSMKPDTEESRQI